MIRHPHVQAVAAMAAAALATIAHAHSPFATRVIAYQPAPGQFVQDLAYRFPERALGAPVGGGLRAADNSKMVTLGGFGGSITLGFDHAIYDNPFNAFGVDFIVFGNAFWVIGDPARRFAEAGVVEVSRDDNGNGQADDAWYLIPGSDLAPPVARIAAMWDDNTADSALPPANPLWIPDGRAGVWTTAGFSPAANNPAFNTHVLVNTGAAGPGREMAFGYADLSPTALLGDRDGDNIIDDADANPDTFYTRADDPQALGLSPGSGGGDGFDIADAVDPATGASPTPPLAWIHFVRISTGANAIHPSLGEISTEIAAIADARPTYTADWNRDTTISVQDIFDFLASYFGGSPIQEGGGADFNDSGATTVQDIFDFLVAYFAG